MCHSTRLHMKIVPPDRLMTVDFPTRMALLTYSFVLLSLWLGFQTCASEEIRPIACGADHLCFCFASGRTFQVQCYKLGLRVAPIIPDNTTGIYLNNNYLTSLPPDMFSKTINLSSVDFSGNRLTDLSPNLFSATVNLRELFLSRNQLTSIHEGTFSNVRKLKQLYLDENEISSSLEDVFADLDNLWKLSLSGNKLTYIHENAFSNLRKLDSLYLSSNRLTSLHNNTFASQGNLAQLYLSNNQLTFLPSGIFSKLDRLIVLYLSNNQLTNIPCDVRFRILKLSQNNLSSLPSCLLERSGGDVVTLMDLSDNDLPSIPTDLFANTPEVSLLYFRGNRISVIPEDLFAHTTISLSLDFGNNTIREIPPNLFRRNHTVSFVQFQHNQLTYLHQGTFTGLHAVEYIFLNNNRLQMMDGGVFTGIPASGIFLYHNDMETVSIDWFDTRSSVNIYMFDNPIRNISGKPPNTNTGMELFVNCSTLEKLPVFYQDINSVCVNEVFVPVVELNYTITPSVRDAFKSEDGWHCSDSNRSLVCSPCHRGTSGEDGSCSRCPAGGFYQDEIGATSCKLCDVGTFVNNTGGIYLSDCRVCPGGTDLSKHAEYRACYCKDNYTRKHRFQGCQPCPPDSGLDCSLDYQYLSPGYYWNWSFAGVNLTEYQNFVINLGTENASYSNQSVTYKQGMPTVLKCPRSDSCKNSKSHTPEGIEGSCNVGYRGWQCIKCEKDYFPVLNNCSECPRGWVVVCVMLVMLLAVFGIFAAPLIWQHYRDVAGRSSRSNIAKFSSRVKILLGFYQVIGELTESFHEIQWADALLVLGEFMNFLQFHILEFFARPRCLDERLTINPLWQFIFGVLSPIIPLFAFFFTLTRRACLTYGGHYGEAELTEKINKAKARLYTFVLLFFFVTYPPTCSAILEVLPTACEPFDVVQNSNLSISLLRSDVDIKCGDIRVYQLLAWAAIVLYGMPFPSVLFYLLWIHCKNRGTLQQSEGIIEETVDVDTALPNEETPSLNEDDPLLNEDTPLINEVGTPLANEVGTPLTNEIGTPLANEVGTPLTNEVRTEHHHDIPVWLNFLCENYRPECWYWEVVELGRKVAQTMLISLFGWENSLVKLFTIIFSVGFLVANVRLSPITDVFEQMLQIFSLTVICVNLLVAAIPFTSDDYVIWLSIILIILDVSLVIIIVGERLFAAVQYCSSSTRDPEEDIPPVEQDSLVSQQEEDASQDEEGAASISQSHFRGGGGYFGQEHVVV